MFMVFGKFPISFLLFKFTLLHFSLLIIKNLILTSIHEKKSLLISKRTWTYLIFFNN